MVILSDMSDEPLKPEKPKIRVFAQPSALTHELADRICALLVEGASINDISEMPGLPSKSTIWRWRKDDPAFNERILLASNNKRMKWLGVRKSAERAPRESQLTSSIKDTREAAPQPYLERTTPLAIMLARMVKLWANGTAPDADQREAVSIAKDAAPYVHPKLSSVEARVTRRDLSELGELELLEELAALRGRDDPGEGDRASPLN